MIIYFFNIHKKKLNFYICKNAIFLLKKLKLIMFNVKYQT